VILNAEHRRNRATKRSHSTGGARGIIIPSYFDRGQFFGRVAKVPEGVQRGGRPAVVVLADQKVRRLGYAQRSDQMEQHPNGARQTERHVRDERAERVREQYAGDDEELKYRPQTTCEQRCVFINGRAYMFKENGICARFSVQLVSTKDGPVDDEN